jgi:hypothetical protein
VASTAGIGRPTPYPAESRGLILKRLSETELRRLAGRLRRAPRNEAAAYYERERAGLGVAFLAEAQRC